MKKIILISAIYGAILLFASCSGNDATNSDSNKLAKEQDDQKSDSVSIEKDINFAIAAENGGLMEVKLGRLALTNAASQQVKEFGQMMIDDHSKANEQLIMLSTSKYISFPDSLNDDNQKKYNDLSKKKGAAFDKEYIALMVDDHKDDITDFKKEADSGNDADIKTWAINKASMLNHHLQAADSIKNTLK